MKKKKRICPIILSLLTCIFLVACESDTVDGTSAELQSQIEQLQKENINLTQQVDQLSASTDLNGSETDSNQDSNSESGRAEIEVGTAYTIEELCEFTVAAATLKKEVLPSNPAQFYTYYSEEDGKTYLDVIIHVKNLRTTARGADEFGKVTAIIGSGYEYTGFSTIEETNGSDFTYTNITNVAPLETAILHYLIKIPNELADDTSSSIIANITMLDQDYSLKVR